MIAITIPDKIRSLREASSITQKQLGMILGYPEGSAQMMIARWENGTRPVPLDKLRALAKALDIPLEYLIP